MEETRPVIEYLELSDLIAIHRRHLSSEGIETNFAGVLHNPNSLEYLLHVVRVGGREGDPYPTLADKAAVYAFNIITRHVFVDGKQTDWHDGHALVFEPEQSRSERNYKQGNCECCSFYSRKQNGFRRICRLDKQSNHFF